MKKIFTNTVIFFLINLLVCMAQSKVIRSGNGYYLSDVVIIKIKEGTALSQDPSRLHIYLNTKLGSQKVKEIDKVFDSRKVLHKGKNSLSGIYYLKIGSDDNPQILAEQLSSAKEIEWAEPKYVRKVCYDVNDEYFISGYQQHLNLIKAKEAWEITKGNSEIVIGIIDTGVEIDHPDLMANIYVNKNEIPNNGKDDDDSGEYIDDVNGWDFGGLNGTPDNNPREDFSPQNGYHGTHVAGIASAVTDNLLGIASIGFNCKILPVKASKDAYRDEHNIPFIIYGFEGIKYAVDKGAKIICCSWGGYKHSKFEQEIINYAVSKGVLVVAAAGNDNSRNQFYPASYNGVFSVGWSNIDDTRSIASNFGEFIDVMAPGTAIYSTWPQISGISPPYFQTGGSSMSAPLVAGLAGLVISVFPDFSVEQIAEQIRVTCDNIYKKNTVDFEYLLGSGRINALNAVSQHNTFSLRVIEVETTSLINAASYSEDTTAIELTFKNYLSPVSNAVVTISSKEPFVNFIINTFEIGRVDESEIVKTGSNKFLFTLTKDAPQDTLIYFLLKYEAQGYSDFQWIPISINPSYKTHEGSKITVSVTGKGGLGFSNYKINSKGDGFKYLSDQNLLQESGLLFGTSAEKLIDGIRIKNEQSSDLRILKSITIKNDNFVNSTYSLINDNGAGNSKLGITTQVFSYSFNSEPDDSYIILHFVLENNSQESIKNFYLGYFLDWNLAPVYYYSDTVAYDLNGNFAYAFNKKQIGTVVGAALLSSQNLGYMGINNRWRVGEVIFEDGFNDEEKWYSISNGIVNNGVSGDVSFVISGGPINIDVGEKEKFTFAIAAASNKDELRQGIDRSREKYISFVSSAETNNKPMSQDFVLYQNYPNPFNPSTTIEYIIPNAETRHGASPKHVTLKVYDILGREIATLVNEQQLPGKYLVQFNVETRRGESLPSGVYFYRLSVGRYSSTHKMILLK